MRKGKKARSAPSRKVQYCTWEKEPLLSSVCPITLFLTVPPVQRHRKQCHLSINLSHRGNNTRFRFLMSFVRAAAVEYLLWAFIYQIQALERPRC